MLKYLLSALTKCTNTSPHESDPMKHGSEVWMHHGQNITKYSHEGQGMWGRAVGQVLSQQVAQTESQHSSHQHHLPN